MSTLSIAAAPALPLHTAGPYVAGAYVVFLALVLVYVAIMAARLARSERELAELKRDVQARGDQDADPAAGVLAAEDDQLAHATVAEGVERSP